MKKVTYTLEQIENIVGLLNRLEIKGIGQARTLAAIAMILDSGVITEDDGLKAGTESEKGKAAAESREPAAEKQQESGKPAAESREPVAGKQQESGKPAAEEQQEGGELVAGSRNRR